MMLKKSVVLLISICLVSFGFVLYYYQMFHFETMVNPQGHELQSVVSLHEDDTPVLQDDSILELLNNEDEIAVDFTQNLPTQITEDIQEAPSSSLAIQEVQGVDPHLFKALEKKVFLTPQERKDFFAEFGLEYVNKTLIDYVPIFDMDFKASDKYLSDVAGHDLSTDLYGADIANQTLMPMSIRWIDNRVGHGVFAEDDLAEGGFVGIYGGEVRDRLLIGNKDYAWSYPAETLEGGKISLNACMKGNELRFINDGQDPNCYAKFVIGLDNLWHACYLAAKDIKKGDQLLVSYGPAYWDTRKYPYQELAGV